MPIYYYPSFSSQYLLYLLGILIVLYAQGRVSSAYNKYKQIPNKKGIRGVDAARIILDRNGLQDVRIEPAKGGTLSDHYDPVHRVVRLSSDIYYNASIASVSVAAHECGHAIQHKVGYAALSWRSKLLPVANICSQLGWITLILGLFLFSSFSSLVYLGIGMILVVFLFQVVTLPVEFNASTRAIAQISELQLMQDDERPMVRSILKAAAFTYVASVLSTLLQIFRILIMVLGRRNND